MTQVKESALDANIAIIEATVAQVSSTTKIPTPPKSFHSQQYSRLELVLEQNDSPVRRLSVTEILPIYAGDSIRAYINIKNIYGHHPRVNYGPTRDLSEDESPVRIEKLDPNGKFLASYNFEIGE